jgi:hypothetical protein
MINTYMHEGHERRQRSQGEGGYTVHVPDLPGCISEETPRDRVGASMGCRRA